MENGRESTLKALPDIKIDIKMDKEYENLLDEILKYMYPDDISKLRNRIDELEDKLRKTCKLAGDIGRMYVDKCSEQEAKDYYAWTLEKSKEIGIIF